MLTVKLEKREGYEVHECLSYRVGPPPEEGWSTTKVLTLESAPLNDRSDNLRQKYFGFSNANGASSQDTPDDVFTAYVMNSHGKTVDVIRL